MTFPQFAYKNVTRNSRSYLAFYLSSSFAVMIFFMFAMFIFHPELREGYINNIAKKGMVAAEWMIFGFSILFVLYSVSAFLRTRKKEFGILTIQGASPGQLRWLITLENVLIGLASILTGVIGGTILAKAFFTAGSYILDMESLPLYLPWKAVGLTATVFLPLFLIISQFTLFIIRTEATVSLLKGSQRQKKEPRLSIFFSIVGGAFLAAGYGMAWKIKVDTTSAFAILICTIIGTYFFYSQLSVWMLKVLKRNKQFYWRGFNLLWVSDLTYRVRDNARLFFIVSIISSVAFTATGVLAVYKSAFSPGDALFEMEYMSYPDNKEESKELQYIESKLTEQHFGYKQKAIEAVDTRYIQNGLVPPILITTQKELMNILPDWKKKELNKEEGIYFMDGRDKERDIPSVLHLKDQPIAISIKSTEKPILASTPLLIVSDPVYNELKKQLGVTNIYGFEISNWKETLGISDQIQSYVYGDYSNVQSDFFSKASDYFMMVQMPSLSLFIGLFIATVFFFAAGSFLYFRLFTDLNDEQEKYKSLAKIGLSEQEMTKSATIQMAILFFLPFILAIVNAGFALKVLEREMVMNVFGPGFITIASFLLLQIFFFIVVRFNYVKHLKGYVYRI